MNKIYKEISDMTDEFREMAFGLTTDEERIKEAVQELMLYFLQANPDVIKKIYEKDGLLGIKKYGAVVLKRSLTSKYSPFYYKYEKYYKNLDSFNYVSSYTKHDNFDMSNANNYFKDIENLAEKEDFSKWKKLEEIDMELDKLYWYDREMFKLYYYKDDGRNTLDSIAKKTRISRNSVFNTISKVRDILKKKLNE